MVRHTPVTSSVVRAVRTSVVLSSSVVLAFGLSGCGHRRSAMRPVYGTPVQTTPVLSAPEVVRPGSVMSTVPDATDPFVTPSVLTPSVGAAGAGGVPAGGGSPPAADAPERPPLTPPETGSTASPSSTGISLSRPSTNRATGRQSSLAGTRTKVTLRNQVKPYLENPEDLFAPPKADRPWKYVVLHHSATNEGGYDQIDRDHRKVLGFEGCGYHFVIGNGTESPDGQIEVADRWLNQKNGVHCRNGKTPDVNEYGIGICLVGNFDQIEPTVKQVAAAKALVAYLSDRYVIPADHLGTHDQFATGPTACPGKNFPAEAILGASHVAQR